ncbi:MAG TPA: VWA domain-containing protein [Elusimicrobiota bacterium]|nr:VWA domain-containing protein [Elusimicrobiota bacterium]
MWKNPAWLLWMIPALAATAGAAWTANRRRRRLDALLGTPNTLKSLVPQEISSRRALKLALQMSALALIFVALAGPQWGVELVANKSKTRQIMIAVDTSLSMSAQDASPSRLEAAKRDLSLLLDELSGNRIGLMTFSGEPAVICPMTLDEDALRQAADTLSPDMLPVPGTAFGPAIARAAQILQQYPGVKSLIILSDGGDHKSNPLAAAKAAAPLGMRIYAIGFGTAEGAPIPLRDSSGSLTGYKKDGKGNTVITRLHEDVLSGLASATGGAYYRANSDQSEVSAVAQQILKTTQAQSVSTSTERYRNHFQWPLALAFVLLLAGFLIPETGDVWGKSEKSGKPAALGGLILLLAFSASGARAATTESDLRAGNKLYGKESYLQALDDYSAAAAKSPGDIRPVFNSGDALFRLEDMDEASRAFKALSDSSAPPRVRSAASYNLGDIDFVQGDYKAAVGDFRKAVVLDPADADARYNLAVALRALKNPPKKKNQKQNQRNKNNQNPQNQSNPKPQGGGQNGQNQQPAPNPQNQISPQDAKRIMQAVAEREKPMANKFKNQAKQQAPGGEDW